MKQEDKIYKNYPCKIVLITNLANLSVYLIGIYFLYFIWLPFAVIYLFYLLYLELKLYQGSCACCWYYGRMCAFGRGKIAPLLVKKDDPKKFCQRVFKFKDFLTHIFVALVPLVAGIVLLVQEFSFFVLALSLWPIVFNFVGNPVIFGKLACPHCQQGKICCPACEFFAKTQAKKGKKK